MGRFLDDWKQAKKKFEEKTKRSKPSVKFLGIFRRSSGLEDACKGLDDALAKRDPEALDKAGAAFERARDSYLETLTEASKKEEEDQDYIKYLGDLRKGLADVESEFIKERDELLKDLWAELQKSMEKLRGQLDEEKEGLAKLVANIEATLRLSNTRLEMMAQSLKAGAPKEAETQQKFLVDDVKKVATLLSGITKFWNGVKKKVDTQLSSWAKEHELLIEVHEADFKQEKKAIDTKLDDLKHNYDAVQEEQFDAQAKAILQKAVDAVKEAKKPAVQK